MENGKWVLAAETVVPTEKKDWMVESLDSLINEHEQLYSESYENEPLSSNISGNLSFYNCLSLSSSSPVLNEEVVQGNNNKNEYELLINNVNFCENISQKISLLEEDFKILKNENKSLKSILKETEIHVDEQLSYIYKLEEDLARLNQYGRRENIEIIGIPNNVSDKKLEIEVIKILRKIGLDHINHFKIVGCHRIGGRDEKGNKNTIVRFLNRKDAYATLKNKRNVNLCKELGYDNLILMENLCPAFKSIYEEMLELKNNGVMNKVWTYNGIINYKVTDNDDEKPKKLFHESDLDKFY